MLKRFFEKWKVLRNMNSSLCNFIIQVHVSDPKYGRNWTLKATIIYLVSLIFPIRCTDFIQLPSCCVFISIFINITFSSCDKKNLDSVGQEMSCVMVSHGFSRNMLQIDYLQATNFYMMKRNFHCTQFWSPSHDAIIPRWEKLLDKKVCLIKRGLTHL